MTRKTIGLRFAAVCLAAALSAVNVALAEEVTWREVDPDNLVLMELTEGQVVIELSPRFAPQTVKQFRRLVREKFYNGLGFYRVIDGFVAQAGDGSDLGELSQVPLIDAEFEFELDVDSPYLPVQSNDLFAAETGFVDGFAVARDRRSNSAWPVHCPGVVAMARNEGRDSSRTDFYIVIGQAPRYLDRNMNVFGRVIAGMDVVQRVQRGRASDNGIIEDETTSTRIRDAVIASDLEKPQRPTAYVMDTMSQGFSDLLDDRRNRKQKFFHNNY